MSRGTLVRGVVIAAMAVVLLPGRLVVDATEAEAIPQTHEELTPEELRNEAAKPETPYRNVRYGPYDENVLDFWKAASDEPTPVVVYFHWGSFQVGDKRALRVEWLRSLLEGGISVVAANYRLVHTAPLPAALHDGARVVQFMRSMADEWNIDKEKVAVFGESAGACLAMWVAFHDDLARPDSEDAIERESSRVWCVAAYNGQSSNDPRWIRQWLPGEPPLRDETLLNLFGIQDPEELEQPEVRELIEEASPINHVTRDDPPIYMGYGIRGFSEIMPTVMNHHPVYGIRLKQLMDAWGIEAILSFFGNPNPADPYGNAEAFFKAKLSAAPQR